MQFPGPQSLFNMLITKLFLLLQKEKDKFVFALRSRCIVVMEGPSLFNIFIMVIVEGQSRPRDALKRVGKWNINTGTA